MCQLHSLPTTQGLGLAKKGSVTRQGQGGEKPHPWWKPHETDCPQHPHCAPCRTGPQGFNCMHKDVAPRVFSIPSTGCCFSFQGRDNRLKKVHIIHRNTQTYESPWKSGQAGKLSPLFLINVGLNLTRKLECSLGNIKHQHSVLSGPISQGGGGGRAGGFMLVICLCFKKWHPVDSSRGSQISLSHKPVFLITWGEDLA